MTTIAPDDLAKRLPSILQAVAAGQEFLVAEAGQPVARLIPPTFLPEERLTPDQWQKGFDDWMKDVESRADQYPSGFVLDDSYDAIYGERENSQL